jgi:hypothetical protein
MCACLRVLDADDASFGRRVHSSVVRAADCRSAGPCFKSGCALFVVVSKSVRDAEETERERERERGRERERERGRGIERDGERERRGERDRQRERDLFA